MKEENDESHIAETAEEGTLPLYRVFDFCCEHFLGIGELGASR